MPENYIPSIMNAAFEAAVSAREKGNLPVGCVITDGAKILSVGENSVMSPSFHPGRHAEILALNAIDEIDITRIEKLSIYSTLEPCIMCLGSIILHRLEAVFFASLDTERGAGYLIPEIAKKYPERYLPHWIGPTDPVRGDPLYIEAREMYRKVRFPE
jgi:tRNA(adenine34) deaminase